jgi:hypothetical protein
VSRGCCACTRADDTSRAHAAIRIARRPGFIGETMTLDTVGKRWEFRAGTGSSVRLDGAELEGMSHTIGLLADARFTMNRLSLQPERLAPREPESR